MIIQRSMGEVASWWFEEPGVPSGDLRAELQTLIERCGAVAEILERHDLLRPHAVTMARWLRPEPGEVSGLLLVDPSATKLIVPPDVTATGLTALLRRFFDEREQERGFLFPAQVDVTGTGVLIDASGAREEVEDVTWIGATKLYELVVVVNTQTDAWLPYTLRADPQHEVYRANAPRLEAALLEVRDRLGFDPLTDDDSPYSRKVGFRLENVRYADGEVADVS